jgi:hypothetical protein
MMTLTLRPAFGRDYKTADEARKGWASGHDFALEPSGSYTSIRDMQNGVWADAGFDVGALVIRFNKMQRVLYIKLP